MQKDVETPYALSVQTFKHVLTEVRAVVRVIGFLGAQAGSHKAPAGTDMEPDKQSIVPIPMVPDISLAGGLDMYAAHSFQLAGC